jgi:hypothetical protein
MVEAMVEAMAGNMEETMVEKIVLPLMITVLPPVPVVPATRIIGMMTMIGCKF